MDRITNKIILRHIQKTSKSALYEQKRAETLTRTLKNTLKAILLVVSFILILTQLGVNTTAIIAGAGILAAAIGFGFQSLIKDVISGFFILAENQYRVGDNVTIANVYGKVLEVGLRTTILRGDDGVIHYIPNGQILLTSNFSRNKSGVYFDISISPKANINKAIDIINSVGIRLSKDKIFADDIVEAPYFARLESFSEQGVMLKVLGETKPNMQWYISSEFRKRILLEFKKNKIQLGTEPSIKTIKDLEETIRRYN
jgi:small conductance mechanosensitive channel